MKNKGYIKLVFFFFINILSFVYLVKDVRGTDDRIVAIVNDEVVTESELRISKVFPNKSISFLVEKKLQLQVAKKKGIIIQSSDVSSAIDDIKLVNSFKSDKEFEDALLKEGNSLEDYKRDIAEQLTILKLINREIKPKITVIEKEIEDYYLSHKNLFPLQEEIRIGSIYIPVKPSDPVETIQEVKKRINDILSDLKNNIPFTDIKNRYLEFPQVYVSEDLGYVKKGDLLQELDTYAFNLKEGEISDVIYTPVGLYIIKLLEKKGIKYKPFEDVKDMIRETLFQDKTERLYKEWLYEIKSSSYIEVKK